MTTTAVPTVQSISPQEARAARERDPAIQMIDVRTPAEYEQAHAEGARPIPLDRLNGTALQEVKNAAGERPVYVICKSGGRSAKAAEMLMSAGCHPVYSVAGGTTAWEQAGLPVVRGTRKTISIERQVRIAAGAIVLTGAVLAWFVHPAFVWLSGFVGAGLVFAGVTDSCAMGLLLARMPWNR